MVASGNRRKSGGIHLKGESGRCQGSEVAVESPGCIRLSITTPALAVSGRFDFGAGRGRIKLRWSSLTTRVAMPGERPGQDARGVGKGGVREACVSIVYLRLRRAAGRQALQLLRSVAGEEIRAAGSAAQPLHQGGDDAAAAAAHRLAHSASRRRQNNEGNLRKKDKETGQATATSCFWVRADQGVSQVPPLRLLSPGCVPRGADPQVLCHQHRPDIAAAAARLDPEKLSCCQV